MKKILTIIIISLVILISITASPVFKTAINLEYSYDTNVFSNPLPSYEAPQRDNNGNIIIPHVFPWLEYKNTHPFIQKHSIGGNITFDLFFKETARVGLSSSLNVKYPLAAKEIKPIPHQTDGFDGDWYYEENDSTSKQKTAVFFGFGPVFMAQFDFADIGCAVRLSLGGYDYTDSELILGIQAEPFIHVYLPHNIFLNIKLTYDAHLMRFIHNETTDLYTPNYQMVSAAPSIGIGFRF